MLRNLFYWFCLVLFYGMGNHALAQGLSNVKSKVYFGSDTLIFLDSNLIYPNSIQVFQKDNLLPFGAYSYQPEKGGLVLRDISKDTLTITYRVLPISYQTILQKRDTSQIYQVIKGDREKFLFTTANENQDVFGGTGLNKSGSISRGVTFGNNQNLGVNSSLNLELSGDIAPNLKLLAVVSDDNLPIQPDGNTNQLQEFDQVFIQLYNDKNKLIAGDFWLRKPEGYFTQYQKRAQGLTFENLYQINKDATFKTQLSAALSKGKFNRQIIPGVEGNQGPYRLIGSENEPFILILAGSEKISIDGKLLERGQEYDYVINYNSAEIIFTSRNQITKDTRIVAEFQYSDQNYARSVLQSSLVYQSKKLKGWFNAYSEQDAKNQNLQQTLSFDQKKRLSEIGDSLSLARISSIDSVGNLENQVMYKLIDSLGFDSVLVFSVNQDSAIYRAVFQIVGEQKGDYILDNFNALGRVFKWVAPVGGVPQGNYAASRILVAPKQQQLVEGGILYQFSKNWSVENSVAISTFDQNTFSRLDQADDNGFANRFKVKGEFPLSKDSIPKWKASTGASFEYLDPNFNPIQQYRSVEFDRDWNTRNKGYEGQQIFTGIEGGVEKLGVGQHNLELKRFEIGNEFEANRLEASGDWNSKGFRANYLGSYLQSNAESSSEFLRRKVDVSQQVRKVRIGYKDDYENNQYQNTLQLETNSYSFYDYQFYLANGDSSKNEYKVFYRERIDKISDSSRLSLAAVGKTVGGELGIFDWKNQNIKLVTSYRELVIKNSDLIQQTPENNLLGRIEYSLRAYKGALTVSNFYEVGSGLELKREFLYIKVNDGQGIYTWIDYNGDMIKDLNEFEIAQYIDQASYIRVFTPSNTYVKAFSNELNQSVFWRPEKLWGGQKGIRKGLSYFSDQSRLRIYRKTNSADGIDAFNPFLSAIGDTSLILTNYNFRNSLFFNRTSNIFSMEYVYQDVRGKNLLATGFDSRSNGYNEISSRVNIARKLTIESSYLRGLKEVNADYTSNRNYSINYFFIEPIIRFQPSTKFRISMEAKYTEKKNSIEFGGDRAFLSEVGADLKYNQTNKGSFQAGVKTIHINFIGIQNSAVGYELLESLKPGVNYTWNLSYQRSLSKNLQISIQYNGRKSEENLAIHSGGMEVRAFF